MSNTFCFIQIPIDHTTSWFLYLHLCSRSYFFFFGKCRVQQKNKIQFYVNYLSAKTNNPHVNVMSY